MSLHERTSGDRLYSFAFRGELAQEAVSKVTNESRETEGLLAIRRTVSIELLDDEKVTSAERMAVVFVAITAFESMVRDLIENSLLEDVGENWWVECVSERVRKRAETRQEEEEKRKFHTQRGARLLDYTDMGDLVSIFIQNWDKFEYVIMADLDWVKHIIGGLSRTRNVIMHGGEVERMDIQRVGMFIRDWVKQVGA